MVFPQKIVLFRYVLIVKARNGLTGPLLGRVPWVPGTRKILSSYVLAPVNFYQITGKELPGTRKILTPLICGTHGLKFLTRALFKIKIGHYSDGKILLLDAMILYECS